MIDLLSNEEKIARYKELSRRSDELFKQNNLAERNKLCEPIRQLYKEIDWGFKVGEKVLLRESGRKMPAKIIAHTEDNYFDVRKDSGGDIIVPAQLLVKIVEDEPAQIEQLELKLF